MEKVSFGAMSTISSFFNIFFTLPQNYHTAMRLGIHTKKLNRNRGGWENQTCTGKGFVF